MIEMGLFEIYYFILKMYVMCTYENRLHEAIVLSTHNIHVHVLLF